MITALLDCKNIMGFDAEPINGTGFLEDALNQQSALPIILIIVNDSLLAFCGGLFAFVSMTGKPATVTGTFAGRDRQLYF